ncbi:hypothetical protein VNO77_20222 [Canavalia gladiata]|uniref:Uncharacterized protein n=1 Tax=Canavalia gladiata TaxID=3824 RepID=A0AAN9LU25_CANGL
MLKSVAKLMDKIFVDTLIGCKSVANLRHINWLQSEYVLASVPPGVKLHPNTPQSVEPFVIPHLLTKLVLLLALVGMGSLKAANLEVKVPYMVNNRTSLGRTTHPVRCDFNMLKWLVRLKPMQEVPGSIPHVKLFVLCSLICQFIGIGQQSNGYANWAALGAMLY